jgi:transcriptional activator SPT7
VLANLAAEYLKNAGRTMRFFCDRSGHFFSAQVNATSRWMRLSALYHLFSRLMSLSPAQQDTVTHTLEANGLHGVSDLEIYIKDDIERYGSRLNDLLRKLEQARRDQLEGNDKRAFGDEELFAQDGEAMVLSVHPTCSQFSV